MSVASADSQPTAGQGSELDQPSPKWPSSWPQTQQRDQLRLPKPGPQTWERRSNASYCMPVRFGNCLLHCITVAIDNWYRSGWLAISSHVPIADRIQSTPCHYYHPSPLSCYPPSSEFISPPHTSFAPKAKVIFCSPQFFPCHLLDETAGARLGLEEHSTGPEAVFLLVSLSKDIWFWHRYTQFWAYWYLSAPTRKALVFPRVYNLAIMAYLG